MERGARAGDLGGHAVDLDAAAFRLGEADHRPEQVALALPLERGDADDLTSPDIKRHVAQNAAGEAPNAERDGRAVGDQRLRGGRLTRASADHHLENVLVRSAGQLDGADAAAIAQDGGARTQGAHLAEAVGNVEDGGLQVLLPAHELKQPFDVRQRGRRLIEDQELRGMGEGAHDLKPLTIRKRKHTDGRVRIKVGESVVVKNLAS